AAAGADLCALSEPQASLRQGAPLRRIPERALLAGAGLERGVRGLALLLALPLMALAAEPDWLLVAPQRVVAGQRFEVIAVAPPDEPLPDEISLRVQVDVTELLLPAQAESL